MVCALAAEARHLGFSTRRGQPPGPLVGLDERTLVAVSGMVLQLGEWYVDRVREAALARAFMVSEAGPRIVPSAFGVEAGVVGSAAIALDHFAYRQ